MGFGPGDLDCDEVLADVYLYLDDETDQNVRDRMKVHLHECAPCLRQFGLEQDMKSLVARTCGGDRAPARTARAHPRAFDRSDDRDHPPRVSRRLTPLLESLLVADHGLGAARVLLTCRRLGIKSVLVGLSAEYAVRDHRRTGH